MPGVDGELNQSLEKAGRVADFLELAELCASTPCTARSPAAAHFREESQTPEGEALRDDEHFCLRGGLGVRPARAAAGPPQGAADVRARPLRVKRSYK